MRRVIALISGGLDSALAARMVQDQGLEVHGLNVRPLYGATDVQARQAADVLGIPLEIADVEDDFLAMLRYPRFGYGKGMNPCVDCRIYMSRIAARRMEQLEACAVVSGEVLGQRPMSQKRPDLEAVAKHSGLEGRLLRPLSALLLEPTIAEREGLIDRERLGRFTGRSRRPLLRLAEQFGIPPLEGPSTGCPLTEPLFSHKVRDLFRHAGEAHPTRWEFDLLTVGKHFRFSPETKIVVGWNEEENGRLRAMADRAVGVSVAWLHPESFVGPDVLVVGEISERAVDTAAMLVLQRGRCEDDEGASVRVSLGERVWNVQPSMCEMAAGEMRI